MSPHDYMRKGQKVAGNGGAEVNSGRKGGGNVEFVWYYRGRGHA